MTSRTTEVAGKVATAATRRKPLRVYGVGVDVAHVPRFERSLARFGDRFLRRAFHPQEIQELYARPEAQRPTYLASRWAVKEATFKAFRRYRVLFPEIHVTRQGDEQDELDVVVPTALPVAEHSLALHLQFSGQTAALAERLRLLEPHASISHDGDYAVAYVLLQQEADAPQEQRPQDADVDATSSSS